jgi:threonine dehydratase
MIAAGQIRSSDRSSKQRVAHEQVALVLALTADSQAHAARAVTRRVLDIDDVATEAEVRVRGIEVIDWRLRIDVDPEHAALLHHGFVQEEIRPMQPHGHLQCGLGAADSSDVIQVRVREEDRSDHEAARNDRVEELVDLVARIDDDGLGRFLARDNESILHERRHRGPDDSHRAYDSSMIRTAPIELPGIADVEAAAQRIGIVAWATPLVPSPWLSDLTGADVWLKLETVQATGSYKVRGAANALVLLKAAHPALRTVVTASAGNHGQAVALAGRALGRGVRVYLPAGAPLAKHDALVRLGAEAISTESYEAAEAAAHSDAQESGAAYVSPYNDTDVVAGAGTVALEMLASQPTLDAFFVPLGGGGLLASTAIVARARVKGALVVGCEAAASPAFTAALAAGHPVSVEVHRTMADGLAGNMDPTSITFAAVRDMVDRVEMIDEDAIASAMRDLIRRERLVVEGASAVAVAGVVAAARALAGRRVGLILSGRNVDAHVIDELLRT